MLGAFFSEMGKESVILRGVSVKWGKIVIFTGGASGKIVIFAAVFSVDRHFCEDFNQYRHFEYISKKIRQFRVYFGKNNNFRLFPE